MPELQISADATPKDTKTNTPKTGRYSMDTIPHITANSDLAEVAYRSLNI